MSGFLFAAIIFFAMSSTGPAADAAPAVSGHSVKADPEVVAEGWTRQDLRSAKPAPMPVPAEASFDVPSFDAGVSAKSGPFYPADPTAYPERLHGKVFFSLGLQRFQCSGTLVSSLRGNVVYTAGHCVWDYPTQKWMENLVFIPGYENGSSPFETYAATTLSTPSGFSRDGNLDYDVGLVTLDGNPEADLGGSRRIAFDLGQFQRRYTLYGYPADPDPPYDGERLVGCRSTVALRGAGTPGAIGVAPCDMRKGASGGAWITSGNYLASLTSYTLCDTRPELCSVLWGPSLSSAAKALYTTETAGGSIIPGVKVRYAPPKLVRKRRVLFKFAGTGSTPIRFQCRFDRERFKRCDKRTVVPGLTAGRHRLRVRSVDQTGHQSARTITRTFRVILRKESRR